MSRLAHSFFHPQIDVKRPFNAWGGKRSQASSDSEDKRATFSSWGGKRSAAELVYKRPRFQSWGGKKSSAIRLGDIDDIVQMKRPQFSAWGGKRSWDAHPKLKRPQFSSWGGKRSDEAEFIADGDLLELQGGTGNAENKRKFNSWGGKRAQFNAWGGKRKFNSWGGKRTQMLGKVCFRIACA